MRPARVQKFTGASWSSGLSRIQSCKLAASLGIAISRRIYRPDRRAGFCAARSAQSPSARWPRNSAASDPLKPKFRLELRAQIRTWMRMLALRRLGCSSPGSWRPRATRSPGEPGSTRTQPTCPRAPVNVGRRMLTLAMLANWMAGWLARSLACTSWPADNLLRPVRCRGCNRERWRK